MYDDTTTTVAEKSIGTVGPSFPTEAEWQASQARPLTEAELKTMRYATAQDQIDYKVPTGAMFYVDHNGFTQWNGPDLHEVHGEPGGLYLVQNGEWALNDLVADFSTIRAVGNLTAKPIKKTVKKVKTTAKKTGKKVVAKNKKKVLTAKSKTKVKAKKSKKRSS